MPTLSVTLPSFGPIFRDNNFHQIADLAQMAEQAGVDRIMLTDHVVMGEHTDKYPYGPFPFPPDTAWLEPLASIAHMGRCYWAGEVQHQDSDRPSAPCCGAGQDAGHYGCAVAGSLGSGRGDRLAT